MTCLVVEQHNNVVARDTVRRPSLALPVYQWYGIFIFCVQPAFRRTSFCHATDGSRNPVHMNRAVAAIKPTGSPSVVTTRQSGHISLDSESDIISMGSESEAIRSKPRS